MANWGIRYSVNVSKNMQKWASDWKYSLAAICQPEKFVDIAKLYRYYINKKVPKKTGALRRSAVAKGYATGGGGGYGGAWAMIFWATQGKAEKYGHYQFVGDVYGPNKAVWGQGPNKNGASGVQTGWRSPVTPKRNMGWKMGRPGSYTTHDGRTVTIKGYTTPGTGYDWLKRFHEDSSDEGERAINIMAGRYTYELFCMCSKQTGHPVTPVGGYQVYYHVRGIKNRTGG